MDSIIIKGGKPLLGTINVSGSKNASLPIMAASLLTPYPLELSNIPKLSDIYTMKELLLNHGCEVFEEEMSNGSLNLKITSSNISNYTAPYDIVRKMRASIWVLGPILARFGKAEVSLPGGCAIGARQIDLHIAVLKAMGAIIELKDGYIKAHVDGERLTGCDFAFKKLSVGATINAILAGVLAEGESNLSNCAREPEISDLCVCLNNMGAEIFGIGTSELRIVGKEKLEGAKHRVISDRIEAGTYMIAAAMTRGDVTINEVDTEVMENLICRMREAGIDITSSARSMRIKHVGAIRSTDISTQPFPGFPTDLQAQFMSLMTVADGSSVVTENIFENRFMHIPELCRMGANILINGNNALIRGVESLSGAEVMASDLRASVSLVIAALAAKGETKIRRVYHLDRGYQSLEAKLSACGADIKRVFGDTV